MRFLSCDEALAGHGRFNALFRRVLTSLLSLCLCISQAEPVTAQDAAIDELIVELILNGQVNAQDVVVLRKSSGEWLLPVNALSAAKVQTDGLETIVFNDTVFVELRSIGAQSISFDESRSALAVQLNPSRFQKNVLVSRPSGAVGSVTRGSGSFLNYDFLINHVSGNDSRVLYTEAGTALGQGVGVTSAMVIDRSDSRQSLRLDTTFTQDFPDRMTTLQFGDGITHSPTILGRPVRFGGVQWGTNFRTRPGLVTMPVATLSGQAALPSTIDLYINDVLQTRSTVSPGPFSIISPPLISGDGEVLLKITDLAGQQQVVSQRFYASSALLAPGLSDYAFTLGALRRNYGLRSSDYGDLFIAGSWRQGISDSLTVEAATHGQQGGNMGAEAGATASFAKIGTGLAAIGLSHSEDGAGAQLVAGFERRTKSHSFSIRTQLATDQFRQMGVDANQTLRRLIALFYGYRIDGLGSLAMTYTRQQRGHADPVDILTASLTPRQTPWGSFMLSLTQSRAERTETSVNLLWVMNFGNGNNVSAFHTRPSDAPAQTVLQMQSNQPPGEGWGYRLQAAINAANQVSVFGQNSYGAGRIEVAELNGHTSLRAGISGGFAMLDGQMFASRRIDGSFGIARLPGFGNVRIYVDNQLAGRTNADGYALLPRLHSYLKNHVSVEQLDLPLDASMEQLQVYPVPGWRSGVTIDFPIKNAAAATLDLIDDEGKPVPAGAVVTLLADGKAISEPFAVGEEGLLYLSGLQAENSLRAQWNHGECEAKLRYTPENGSVPYLGKQVCERKGGRP